MEKSHPGGFTWPSAEGAVEELAVHVVALAVGAVDVLAGHVARVAHALPAHAVPLPRADHGAVVPPAAALQLLAALPFGVALAVLPRVSRVAAAKRGEQQAWVSGHAQGPDLRKSGANLGQPHQKTVADWEQTSEMLLFHQS